MLLAEQLVGEARERRVQRMARRERQVSSLSAALFALVTVAIWMFVPFDRHADAFLIVGLTVGYAAISRVRFEFATSYLTPEQLAFTATLLLLPLPFVPIVVVAAAMLSQVPDFVNRAWHYDRWLNCVSDSWFCVGPVLIFGLLAPDEPELADVGVFALSFVAQMAGDLAWTTIRYRLIDGVGPHRAVPFGQIFRNYSDGIQIDALLYPPAVVICLAATSQPLVLLTGPPLVILLDKFARERRERYANALELQRAYRGTVLLLSDVVEFDDPYTADHSRSVVDLAQAIAEEMSVPSEQRQELEFAALLHDIGKIAIPKEIIQKPAQLTDDEYDLVKTHTVEGQLMLDRVGGLLGRVGEIVRSCHERWDGNGYPDGLKEEETPLAARIVFCADAFNAMTTDRVYRRAMSTEAALEELAANAGTQFDPAIVDACISVIQQIEPELAAISPSDHIRALLSETLTHATATDVAGTAQGLGSHRP